MAEDALPTRAWRVVMDKIETDLLEGRLRPGEHLPPERELASALGVGRSSVREALRVLDVMGLIRTATGSGPTSGAIIVATPRGGLAQLLRLQVAAQGFPIGDVVATRLMLEEWAVGVLAAGVAGAASSDGHPADLTEPHALLDAMDASGLTIAEFLALDAQFHVRLAEATGNQVIAATMSGLRSAIESYVRRGSERIPDWQATVRRLRAEHRSIVAAIAGGEPERARALVHGHISGYYAEAGLTGARPAPEA